MSKLIAVTTDFEAAPTFNLRVEMNVVTPVKVLPQMRLSLNGVEGQAVSDGVLLQRIDGERLAVEVEPGDAPFSISVQPATGDGAATAAASQHPRPGDLWLSASLAEGASPINRSGTIRLRTNHPEMPTLELPYVIRLRPMIEARPAQVQLWVTEGENVPSGAIVRLIHNGREAFPVSSVTSSNPDVFTAGVSDSNEPSVAHNLWVRLADGLDAGSLPLRGTVTVGVGGDPERRLEVPVVVTTRRVFRRTAIDGGGGSTGPAAPPAAASQDGTATKPGGGG